MEVTLQGENLEEPRELYFSHPSIRSRRARDAVFEVEISPQTAVGVYSCWLAGRWGASYPVSFSVDDLAEVKETEPNNNLQSAQAVAVESVISGVVEPALDIDHFKLSLKSGQRVFIDCVAERQESRLDATLTLTDGAGKKLAYNRDFRGEDSFIDFTAPGDGDYYLGLTDFLYRGAETIFTGSASPPGRSSISPCRSRSPRGKRRRCRFSAAAFPAGRRPAATGSTGVPWRRSGQKWRLRIFRACSWGALAAIKLPR
jgi:hypothetical protein